MLSGYMLGFGLTMKNTREIETIDRLPMFTVLSSGSRRFWGPLLGYTILPFMSGDMARKLCGVGPFQKNTTFLSVQKYT